MRETPEEAGGGGKGERIGAGWKSATHQEYGLIIPGIGRDVEEARKEVF